MRRLMKAALVVLSAVTVVLGIAPAAQADGFSLSVQQGWTGQDAEVCAGWSGFETGQVVLVQLLQGGSWVDKRTYPRPAMSHGCVEFDASALVPGPGTYSFRALSRVPSTGELVTSEAAALALRQDDGGVFFRNAGMYLATTEWMGAGLRLTTSPQDLVTSLEINRAHGQVVDLQRKAGSTWVTVGRAQAPASGTDVTVRFAIPKRPGHATHRFVSRATVWSPTVITPPFSVYQTAKRTQASYAAEARSYMAKYCPKTPIYIDTPAVSAQGDGRTTATAAYGIATTRGKRVLLTRIELQSDLPPDELRFLALSTCAQTVQYRSVVVGRLGEVQRQAYKVGHGLGLDGQSDCMAFQVLRDSRYSRYGRGCSNAQLVNAAKVWRTYGGKYQAARYPF